MMLPTTETIRSPDRDGRRGGASPDGRMRSILRSITGLLVVASVVALAVLSLLPLAETDVWWIRYLDFVRLQLAGVLAAAVVIGLILAVRHRRALIAVAICAGLLGYHVYRLYPYTPLVDPMGVTATACEPGSRVKIMVSNVQKGNRNAAAFLEVLADADPDVLLALETDDWWDRQLAGLDQRYPYRIQSIPEDARYYGLHLLSRFPLRDPTIDFYFGADTPTVSADIELPDAALSFIGLHPRPPQSFGQPTTIRDGHIASAALQAADAVLPMVVAGDFNAVAWERIVRRAMRVGGLLDPRIGRGLYPSYGVDSAIMAWPLDQILFQDEIGVMRFEMLPSVGADHYPVMATLCVEADLASWQAPAAIEQGDRRELESAVDAAWALRP